MQESTLQNKRHYYSHSIIKEKLAKGMNKMCTRGYMKLSLSSQNKRIYS
jgi:hypothetical protein